VYPGTTSGPKVLSHYYMNTGHSYPEQFSPRFVCVNALNTHATSHSPHTSQDAIYSHVIPHSLQCNFSLDKELSNKLRDITRKELELFLIVKASRPALEPTQPPSWG
jgi:hypothetical protein